MEEILDNLEISQRKKDAAVKRLGLIRQFDRFCADAFSAGISRSEAVKTFCENNQISCRSFYRSMERYRSDGLKGLIDLRGRDDGQMFSPDAFEEFKGLYLTQARLSARTCRNNLLFINKRDNKSWQIPSLGYLYKFIEKNIPLGVQVLHREGLAAYEARCAPYIETDPDSILPGSVWVGDHHQLNCFIRHRNQWLRPWLTCWEDRRSRTITGWNLNTGPNQSTILRACKRAIENYGPPDSVKIDNGRDYDSLMWTGITKKQRILNKGYLDESMVAGLYAMLGISVSFAIKYNPKSKPIERFFDTLDRQFTKTIKTYCGKSEAQKPDNINEILNDPDIIASAHSIESLDELLAKYVAAYNSTAHSGQGMQGSSPNEIMSNRTSRRVLAEGVLDLLARVWSQKLIVGKNGVRFNSLWYGQYDLELTKYQGREVRVSYDPDDLRRVFVYDAATMKLITAAEQAQLIAYGREVSEDYLRIAMQSKRRARNIAKEFVSTRRDDASDLTTLTIDAMNAAAKIHHEEHEVKPNLRPVRTVFDNQVKEHQRIENMKKVRKAVGMESIDEVVDIDFGSLRSDAINTEDVKIFDER